MVSTNLGMNCVSFVDVMKFRAKMTGDEMERNARGPPCPLSGQINMFVKKAYSFSLNKGTHDLEDAWISDFN